VIVVLSVFFKRSIKNRRIYTKLIAPAYMSTALVKCVSLRPEPRVTANLIPLGITGYTEMAETAPDKDIQKREAEAKANPEITDLSDHYLAYVHVLNIL
jgi:hypothetical protein